MNNIKIHYLYHDGFIVETPKYMFIFDYFKNVPLKNGALKNGVITNEVLKTEKNILVFVSHVHFDHFNPVIFDWKSVNSNITYILSSDIEKKDTYPEVNYISEGESLELSDIKIKSYGSTDAGVSFLVCIDGISIFHAGDLNWWHWKDESEQDNLIMEKNFKEKIQNMINEKIDIAFFPVDGRLEEYYYLGGEYFIENLKPKLFIPMHFGDKTSVTSDFKNKMKSYDTNIVEITGRGQEILFSME